jgi:hypothetical protein
LARWLPDGSVECLGRIDQQVKISGYRIEPGEVEHQLRGIAGVREAAVVARDDGAGNAVLCAYYTADDRLDAAELRAALARELPGYMIPTQFAQLERLPLTPNGKLDRAALPAMAGERTASAGYEGPANAAEALLAGIWQEVLGVPLVGVHDHFFELGGHSLNSIQVIARTNAFNLNLSVKDIWDYPTIRQIVQRKELFATPAAPKPNRTYNLGFEVSHEYPFYYPCLQAVLYEKIRYQHGFSLDRAFIPASDGLALPTLEFGRAEHGADRTQCRKLPFVPFQGLARLMDSLGISLAFRSYSNLETGLEAVDRCLQNGEIAAIGGITYFLNYTPDYLLPEEECKARMAAGGAQMPFDHALLVIDRTATGYIVYDTSYGFMGEVPNEDLHRSFVGYRSIPFLKADPEWEAYACRVFHTGDRKSAERGGQILELRIFIGVASDYMSLKEHTYEWEGRSYARFAGLGAIREWASLLSGGGMASAGGPVDAALLQTVLLDWKFHFIFLRDMLDSLERRHDAFRGASRQVEEIVGILSQALDESASPTEGFSARLAQSMARVECQLSVLLPEWKERAEALLERDASDQVAAGAAGSDPGADGR